MKKNNFHDKRLAFVSSYFSSAIIINTIVSCVVVFSGINHSCAEAKLYWFIALTFISLLRVVNHLYVSNDNKNISVDISKFENGKVLLKVTDEGKGFKEKSLNKIFDRFYSNRPEAFGKHSGLGLNIVKNLVDLHGATISASNNIEQKGANVEIVFPKP